MATEVMYIGSALEIDWQNASSSGITAFGTVLGERHWRLTAPIFMDALLALLFKKLVESSKQPVDELDPIEWVFSIFVITVVPLAPQGV